MGKIEKIQEQMEKQTEALYKILQEMQERETIPQGIIQQETLNKILQQVQTQETMLKRTTQQVEYQQEMLNIIFRQVTGNHPPVQFKPPFSIFDKLDLDIEKLTNIAKYIFELYGSSNKSNNENETEE
jgi:phage-related tail protein